MSLLVLIPTLWLFAIAFVVILCQAVARAEAAPANVVEPRHLPRSPRPQALRRTDRAHRRTVGGARRAAH